MVGRHILVIIHLLHPCKQTSTQLRSRKSSPSVFRNDQGGNARHMRTGHRRTLHIGITVLSFRVRRHRTEHGRRRQAVLARIFLLHGLRTARCSQVDGFTIVGIPRRLKVGIESRHTDNIVVSGRICRRTQPVVAGRKDDKASLHHRFLGLVAARILVEVGNRLLHHLRSGLASCAIAP